MVKQVVLELGIEVAESAIQRYDDAKFARDFDAVAEGAGARIVRTASPTK